MMISVMSLVDIRDKLRGHFLKEYWSEADAVYFLVEIRKLLEIERRELERAKKQAELEAWKKQYDSLLLHCDWAVHPAMDRAPARQLVKQVDQGWQKIRAFGNDSRKATPATKEFCRILGLEAFRQQLLQFLKDRKLSTTICDSEDAWVYFINQYSRVVEDCPLVCESDDPSLRHFDKIEIVKEPSRDVFISRDGEVNMELSWRCYWKKKEVVTWTYGLGAGNGSLTSTWPMS